MGTGHNGHSVCRICGAQLRMQTIFKRNMMGLCRAWRSRHESACKKRTPAQRRAWAKKYVGKDCVESSLTVDLDHPAFQDGQTGASFNQTTKIRLEKHMSAPSQNTLNSLISAASAHGDRHGNDAHVETLESLVIAAWAVMTDEQKATLLSSEPCSELLQAVDCIQEHSAPGMP